MKTKPKTAEPFIYIGVPTYPGGMVYRGTCHGLMHAMSTCKTTVQFISSSFTTMSFNTLWCDALNARSQGVTHFAMLHSDIDPEEAWLPKMLQLMKKHRADILSAVIPIKTMEGLTSTAIETGENRIRRFTMREVMAMKEKTFTHPKIILNNGMMLIDLSKPWVERVKFDMRNDIEVSAQGNRRATGLPEDWFFSREARKLGAKCFATADVSCEHAGEAVYVNNRPWGTLVHDEGGVAILP